MAHGAQVQLFGLHAYVGIQVYGLGRCETRLAVVHGIEEVREGGIVVNSHLVWVIGIGDKGVVELETVAHVGPVGAGIGLHAQAVEGPYLINGAIFEGIGAQGCGLCSVGVDLT